MSDPKQPAPAAGSKSIAHPGSTLDIRGLTPARVALARTGVSLTTRHALEFSLAHAQARDAVHSTLGVASLMAALRERGLSAIAVKSAAPDRIEYLRRPDLGRTISDSSATLLATQPETLSSRPKAEHRSTVVERPAVVPAIIGLILADGLSALAVERHALPLLDALLPLFGLNTKAASTHSSADWTLAPIIVAEQARVALGDEIAAALGANVTVVLIGERPGLSSPASLGAYITWAPKRGRTDAERNCVSNIRTEGLDYAAAATKIAWFVTEGRRLGLSGVDLRESSMPIPMPAPLLDLPDDNE